MKSNTQPTQRTGTFYPGENAVHRIPQAPFRFLALVFFALVASLLVGCGGGGGNSAFTDRDGTPGPGEDPTLPLSATLVGGDTSLGQGGSTVYVVALSRAAPSDITLTVETTGAAGLEISPATIPAGARSTSFTVTADAGAAVGARQLLLVAGDDYTVGTPSSATVTVISAALADEFPEATLVGGNTSLSQGGTTSYAVTLDRAAPAEITVEVLTTGLAGLTVSPVVIPAGERSTSFTVTADVGAPVGTRQLLLVAGNEYVLGSPSSAAVTVVLATLPIVELAGGNTTLSPGGSTVYGVRLDQPASSAIDVVLSTVGDETAFVVAGSVTIPAGASSANFPVAAVAGAAVGSSIQLSVVPGAGYVVGDASNPCAGDQCPTVSVVADVLPQVTLSGGAGELSPGSSRTYTLVLNAPASEALSVNLVQSGDAGAFSVPGVVPIAAGASSASFTVDALSSAPLGASIQLSVVAGSRYTVGTPSSATLTVGEGLLPQVTLAGGDVSLAPGGSSRFGLILDRPAPAAGLRVDLVDFGSAGFNVPSQVVIPGGASAEIFEVEALISAPIGTSVTVQVAPGSGYVVGASASARITVTADDLPEVSLFGGPARLVPGGATTLAAVLEEPAPAGGLSLNFIVVDDSGAFQVAGGLPVTVAEGSFATTFEVEALTSAIPGQTAELILVGGSNYRPGSPSSVQLEVSFEALPIVSLLGADTQLEPRDADGTIRGVTTFALFLSEPLGEGLDVNFVLVGDAESFRINGEEFPFDDPLTIPAGEQSFVFQIEAISEREQDEARIALTGGSGYAVDTSESSYVLDISNVRLPLALLIPSLEVTADPLVVPVGETRQFTVQLEGDTRVFPGEPIEVNYVVIRDADAVSLPTFGEVFTIPFGQASVTFDVTRIAEGDADVILVGGQGYRTTGSTMEIR